MVLEHRKYKSFDLIRLAFKVAPGWAALTFLLRLISAVSPFFIIMASANFIDTSLEVLGDASRIHEMYPLIFLLGSLTFVRWFINVFDKFIRSKFLIATRLTYRLELIEKRARLQYRYIEDPDIYDLIKRLTDPADKQIIDQYHTVLGLMDILIQVVSLLGILVINIWWSAVLLLLLSTPVFYIASKAGKKIYDAERDVSKVERKAWYLTEVCSGRNPALERTLYGYGPKMTEDLWERFEFARIHKMAAWRHVEIRMCMSAMLVSLIAGIITLILLQPVMNGLISIGLFISLVTACLSLTRTLAESLSFRLSQLTKQLEYLKELTQFCHLEECEDALSLPSTEVLDFEKLEFREVSFAYPGTKKRILNQLNFTLVPGKHYAFVGENGAGKTTIIKLLTGQYSNYEGEILLNGKELKTYSLSQLKAFFSVAYQDFSRYQMSVRENIRVGNLNDKSDAQISCILKDLELDSLVSTLPKGIDTPLGKIAEDGVDISGGQWQRIALARTLINPAQIKILDEPTAALDPLSESRLYEQFEGIIENKTSLFISHRLGSIKLADEILVFDKGCVVEIGSHDDLMNSGRKYAQMYASQLSWYQDNSQEVGVNG